MDYFVFEIIVWICILCSMNSEGLKTFHIDWNTVLIVGNWAYQNMGDELILLWTVKILKEQKKQIIISCLDPQWLKWFFSQFIETSDIIFIYELPRWIRSFLKWMKNGWFRQLKYFLSVDSLILGGWEIFSWENPNSYHGYRLLWIWPFLLKKLKNLYVMWWIHVPNSKFQLVCLKWFLKKASYLYLRDFQSVDEVKKLWFQNTDFFMDTSYFAYDWAGVKENQYKNPYIVVNVCDQKFADDIIADINSYVQKWYKIYYVPVYHEHWKIKSDEYFKDYLEEKTNLQFEILDRDKDFQHFISILKWAEKVFCTRLHLFLVASYLNVPVKVYPYQKKIIKMQQVLFNFFENE